MRHLFQRLFPILLVWIGGTVGVDPIPAQDNAAGNSGTADVDELLQRLDEIERESRENSGESTGARTEQMAVLFEESSLGTFQYGREAIRYFLTRIILINLNDAPLSLETDELVLLADGDEFRITELHEQLQATTVYAGRETVQYNSVAPPEQLSIPAGGTAAAWLMYSGLPAAPRIPSMTLRIRIGDHQHDVNVNDYHRGLLGVSERRLGPAGCLAIVTVSGELNTINAASFADELDRLGGEGIARVVVSWGESAPALSPLIREWLRSARNNGRVIQNEQMPVLPASISELHYVRLPGDDDRFQQFSANGLVIHPDEATAVSAALRTAYEAIPRSDLRRAVASGSPLTRAAALAHGGSRLVPEDLPLVLRSVSDPEITVRLAAIDALANFPDASAIDALMDAAYGDSDELSAAALDSLASSRYPAAHVEVLKFLEQAPPESRTEIVNVLARHPRPEWSRALFEFTSQEEASLRLSAIRALVQVGHEELPAILANALRDPDEKIREFAFTTLAMENDARSEQAAMEFALQRLEQEPPDGTVTMLLTRTRDQRAVPSLLKHLDEPGDHRNGLIQLLPRVVGDDAIELLVERYDEFSLNEREQVLGVLQGLNAPQARELAIAAINENQTQLIPHATRILGAAGDPESVRILTALLQSEDQQNWTWACNALRMVGGRTARDALIEARQSDNELRRALAIEQLGRLDRESPAFYVKEQALVRMREEKFEDAEALLTLAIQFDGEFGTAFSHRGFVRLRLERLPDALEDFEQAHEINPFDAQAVSGMAIARTLQGDYESGIRLIEEGKARFPNDPFFAYNSACVYGRALERIGETEPSDDRTQTMETYRVRAILLLKQSVEFGFNDWDLLRSDPDLDTLRELEEFEALMQDIARDPSPTDGADIPVEEKEVRE